tara:strand:+ start:346 stop:693 length:348 start_codon:yes stop_codon:yes gene_type:complete
LQLSSIAVIFKLIKIAATIIMLNPPSTILDPKNEKAKYPEARVIVLDDSFNTFQHVANCLLKIIPGMTEKKAWDLTIQVDKVGSAEVWNGNLEQAELYHEQLLRKGLTMAPVEKT